MDNKFTIPTGLTEKKHSGSNDAGTGMKPSGMTPVEISGPVCMINPAPGGKGSSLAGGGAVGSAFMSAFL
ncbi:MAG: hypothetical protein HZA20_06075 [Nitrospirae bacterium]|nr:hypothetical protein [Nitrospirota bacterium]